MPPAACLLATALLIGHALCTADAQMQEPTEELSKFYSTSIASMEELLEFNKDLLLHLEDYIKILQNKVNIVRRAVLHMQRQLPEADQDPVDFLANPLCVYRLIRHMHADWAHLLAFIQEQHGAAQIGYLKESRPHYPTSRDMNDAGQGIYRIQWTYNLLPVHMANGLLDGVQYIASLSPLDCYAISQNIFDNKQYHYAAQWIELTIQLYENAASTELYDVFGFDIIEAHKLQARVLMNLHKYSEALGRVEEALIIYDQHNPTLLRLRNLLSQRLQVEDDLEPLKPSMWPSVSQRCCRGECQPISRLACNYNTTASPFLRLAPIKMELLSLSPYVVLFHDAITPSESQILRRLAKPRMQQRSMTFNKQILKPTQNSGRTSNSVWFDPLDNKLVARIEQRVADITNFDVENSELYQMINYGIGGHYMAHLDHFEQAATLATRSSGDRMATLLFYLNDVPQGGATLLTHLGIAVQPKQGNVIMWYNLNDRGRGENDTIHESCPVIKGSKWVMAKWIDEMSQVFRRPCNRP